MTLWRPKRGPLLTVGRWCHGVIGFAAPWAAWAIARAVAGHSLPDGPERIEAMAAAGYSALGWASVAVLFGGGAWELLTRWLAPWCGWRHPFGDVIDLAAFVAGWLVAVVLCVSR